MKSWREVEEIRETVEMMTGFPGTWCIAGGWAIDLFLGEVTRPHRDVDLAIYRKDQWAIREHFRGWRIQKVVGGQLVDWPPAEWLDPPVHEIHVTLGDGGIEEVGTDQDAPEQGGPVPGSTERGSTEVGGPAPGSTERGGTEVGRTGQRSTEQGGHAKGFVRSLEFLLNDGLDGMWIFRRNPRVMRPLERVMQAGTDGVPILAPAIVLLYKAKAPRAHDQHDFDLVRERLEPDERRWLRSALEIVHPGHEWIRKLEA